MASNPVFTVFVVLIGVSFAACAGIGGETRIVAELREVLEAMDQLPVEEG